MKYRSTVSGLVLSTVLLFVPALIFSAGTAEPQRGEIIQAHASIAPQADIIQRIGGDYIEVELLIKPGQDAHTWDPSPREIERLGRSEVLFVTGLEFEFPITRTLERSGSSVRIVSLTENIQLRQIERHYSDPSVPHSHDNEEGDPHIWLGIDEVRIQTDTIVRELSRLRPEHENYFRQNQADFLLLVDSLEEELTELLADMRGRSVLVYHPAFGYFMDHFGITQIGIEAGGREPSPRQLQMTIEIALAAGVELILTQPEYNDTASRAIARAIGARKAEVTDLGSDWEQLMRDIGTALIQ
ncbi:metal ABC transporter solute-binding protein, Zn/Mn family [Spirochaeta dissipatitropha]